MAQSPRGDSTERQELSILNSHPSEGRGRHEDREGESKGTRGIGQWNTGTIYGDGSSIVKPKSSGRTGVKSAEGGT